MFNKSLAALSNQAIIINVAHNGGTILAYRIDAAQTAIKRFFCVQNFSILHCVGLGGTIGRLARASLVRQFHSIRLPMIGVISSRGYNLIRDAIMNTNSSRVNNAHYQAKTPIFNLYHSRRAIAQGVDGALAMRFKRRFPVSIVKFAGFQGGVL